MIDENTPVEIRLGFKLALIEPLQRFTAGNPTPDDILAVRSLTHIIVNGVIATFADAFGAGQVKH